MQAILDARHDPWPPAHSSRIQLGVFSRVLEVCSNPKGVSEVAIWCGSFASCRGRRAGRAEYLASWNENALESDVAIMDFRDDHQAGCADPEGGQSRNAAQLAPLDPSAFASAGNLRPISPPFLGDAIVDPKSGISVLMRRTDWPSATVMLYELPEK